MVICRRESLKDIARRDFRLEHRRRGGQLLNPTQAQLRSVLFQQNNFQVLDWVKVYYPVAMAQNDVQKTVFAKPFGLFKSLRSPLGLRNTFQLAL